ncbi:MAG: hypothetical protein ACRENS_03180, partial [Candidatus Eiseniibacteriota bacterium]
ILFTPFDLWKMNKSDFKSFVTFVAQDLWHLSYTPPSLAAPVASSMRSFRPVTPSHGAARSLISGGAKRMLVAPGPRPKE